MRKYIYFIVLSVFFSFVFLFLKAIFIEDKSYTEIEDTYIEPEVQVVVVEKDDETDKKATEEKKLREKLKVARVEIEKKKEEEKLNSASKFDIEYFPLIIEEKLTDYASIVSTILSNDKFSDKLFFLSVELHYSLITVRGKMKDKSIKMFGVPDLSKAEFTSVFVHELGHYYDLYYLEKKVFTDPSFYFYDISWKSSKVVKKGVKSQDFVSGYAMTNKYEDFAESFIYFVLHNNDFLEKTKKSESLKNKYNFFRTYVFKNSEFEKTDFSINNEIKNYYWDITKIDTDYQKFLQYIKK